jgi:hypothetical protein
MGLNMKEKQAVTKEYKPRYYKASKKAKKTLLDEFWAFFYILDFFSPIIVY